MNNDMLKAFADSFRDRDDVDIAVDTTDGSVFWPSDIDAVAVSNGDEPGLLLVLKDGGYEFLDASAIARISVTPAEDAYEGGPADEIVLDVPPHRPGREFFQPGPMPEVKGLDPFTKVDSVELDGGTAGGEYTLDEDGSIVSTKQRDTVYPVDVHARMVAGALWTDERVSHREMDAALAEVFAGKIAQFVRAIREDDRTRMDLLAKDVHFAAQPPLPQS